MTTMTMRILQTSRRHGERATFLGWRFGAYSLLSLLLLAGPAQARHDASLGAESQPRLSGAPELSGKVNYLLDPAAVFEPNVGQVDDRVKFLSRASGYVLYLTETEVILDLASSSTMPAWSQSRRGSNEARSVEQVGAVVRMKFVGSNERAAIVGANELPGKVNYFSGDDPTRWRSNIPTYSGVRYRDVYPGVDVVYYGRPGRLEYDLVVRPGADPRTIVFGIEGPDTLSVDGRGDLILRMAGGEVRLEKPVIYQEVDGARKPVAGHYVLRGAHRVGFDVAGYDATRPLIIDPVLSYSSYLGGSGADSAHGIAADPGTAGIVYVVGETTSTNFPTTVGSFQPTLGKGTDCFVAKFDTTKSGQASRLYATYLGGSGVDQCYGIAVDRSPDANVPHNVYITGRTTSTNFPLATKLNGNNRGGSDAIVVKLNDTGSALLYSAYVGGSADELGLAIAVDDEGQAYVTGRTTSTNFPVIGGFQATLGDASGDAFVTKINANGTAFVYSTYLGGNGTDQGQGIAVHGGIAYVTGDTSSTAGFPTTNGFQLTSGGNGDAFVAKVDTTKTGAASLLYSTYLGGSGADHGRGIATDNGGATAYVTGQTASSDLFSILAPPLFFDNQLAGPSDAFVAKIDTNTNGQASVGFLTYLGGSSDDFGNAIAVDGIGHVYVTGQTFGGFPGFPVTDTAFQATYGGGGDAFVARLNPSASGTAALIFASYLGGNKADEGTGIALDSAGSGYVTGTTASATSPPASNQPFPLTLANAYQTVYGGGTTDAFVTRIDEIATTADLSITKAGPPSVDALNQFTYTLSVSNAGPNAASSVKVTDSLPSGATLPSASGSGWTCSAAATVTCTRATLAVGTAPDITITVTAPADATVLSNSASVSAATTDSNTSNNTSATVQTTVVGRADLSITKSGPASVDASSQLIYKLSVSNAGPSTATSVTVSDSLPAGVTGVSASGTGWTCDATVTCTRTSLAVGAAPDITITVTAPAAGGQISNTATVSSSTADPASANNTSNTVQTSVVARPILTVPDPVTVDEGQLVNFSVSATNPNGGTLTFSANNLPFGATFDPGTQTFNWTPNAAQGGPKPYTVSFTVTDGQFSNTKSVSITVNDTLVDTDGDGIPDNLDNCPNDYNPDQLKSSPTDPFGIVCSRSPQTVTANSKLSAPNNTTDQPNVTITVTFSGGTNGTYVVPVGLFNSICRVIDNATGLPLEQGGVPEGPPINLSVGGDVLFVPAGSSQTTSTTFDLRLFYPNLVAGNYTVTCDYVNFAHIPQPEGDDPTIWKGLQNAGSLPFRFPLYAFGGFLSPLPGSNFSQTNTVPVKFTLKDSSGAFVSTCKCILKAQQLDANGNLIPGTQKDAIPTNGKGNQFRYDRTNNQYIFNVSPQTWASQLGPWQLQVYLDDGTIQTVNIVVTP